MLNTTWPYINLALTIAWDAQTRRRIEQLDMPAETISSLMMKHDLNALAKLIETAENLRRRLAIITVQEGMSRVQVANALGLHQATIAKWVKEWNAEHSHESAENFIDVAANT